MNTEAPAPTATRTEAQADVIARLRWLTSLAETGRLEAIAFAIVSPEGVSWGHSAFVHQRDGAGLAAGLEAAKLDMIRHVLPCSCERGPMSKERSA